MSDCLAQTDLGATDDHALHPLQGVVVYDPQEGCARLDQAEAGRREPFAIEQLLQRVDRAEQGRSCPGDLFQAGRAAFTLRVSRARPRAAHGVESPTAPCGGGVRG